MYIHVDTCIYVYMYLHMFTQLVTLYLHVHVSAYVHTTCRIYTTCTHTGPRHPLPLAAVPRAAAEQQTLVISDATAACEVRVHVYCRLLRLYVY